MSDPTVKFCLDHPQKWLQIFQLSGKAGRFGLVKPGHLPNFSPICLFLGGTFKIVIDIAKKKVQTFLNSTMFRGVLWTPSYINSPWCSTKNLKIRPNIGAKNVVKLGERSKFFFKWFLWHDNFESWMDTSRCEERSKIEFDSQYEICTICWSSSSFIIMMWENF